MYDNIKALCDEKGIRVATLAQAIEVRNSLFTELKMGRTKSLSTATLKKIADYFGVSIDSIVAGGIDEEEPPEDDSEAEAIFRKRKLLFDKSARISEHDLDTVIKLVEVMSRH